MLKTYTLYLRAGDAAPRFEPALCRSDFEAMTRARELLAKHPECEMVDVHFGDTHLFFVGRQT